mmetsp:Transcript_54221/g.129206  ORF Transcript_54221/g.129206 Transcript_54221/m.129206 type:complete len:329 (-) Transcript_54221:325-1311(-)
MAEMDWKVRRTLPTGLVKRVAIVGGTHGNETNGVYLAKHFMRNPDEVKRPSFETEVLIANTAAVAQNTRYVEEDLNRCYLVKDLTDDSKAAANLERKRAREVDAVLGPKSAAEPRCDLIIDLHNTTAATGICLLMPPGDDFAHELGHHLMSIDSSVRVVEYNDQGDWFTSPTIGRSGMTFEVGPCPWGCLIPDLFLQSRKLILAMLDRVEAHNAAVASGGMKEETVIMPVYHSIGVSIDYPRNSDGDLTAMVHADLQGSDFKEMKDGDGLFQFFDGEEKLFKRADYQVPEKHAQVYALFVNEAAYYEKKMALMLMGKRESSYKMVKPA